MESIGLSTGTAEINWITSGSLFRPYFDRIIQNERKLDAGFSDMAARAPVHTFLDFFHGGRLDRDFQQAIKLPIGEVQTFPVQYFEDRPLYRTKSQFSTIVETMSASIVEFLQKKYGVGKDLLKPSDSLFNGRYFKIDLLPPFLQTLAGRRANKDVIVVLFQPYQGDHSLAVGALQDGEIALNGLPPPYHDVAKQILGGN